MSLRLGSCTRDYTLNSSCVEANAQTASNEAANYDAKHEKATAEIAKRIEARRDFIGVEWIEDDSSEDEDGEAESEVTRAVRLLDYACGTGAMSRVSLILENNAEIVPWTTASIGRFSTLPDLDPSL